MVPHNTQPIHTILTLTITADSSTHPTTLKRHNDPTHPSACAPCGPTILTLGSLDVDLYIEDELLSPLGVEQQSYVALGAKTPGEAHRAMQASAHGIYGDQGGQDQRQAEQASSIHGDLLDPE